jgi:aspartate 1-decarboxylase
MNGERFTTYLFSGPRGSGVICVNGAAARLAAPGDKLIVMTYGLASDEEIRSFRPRVAFLDGKNRILRLS